MQAPRPIANRALGAKSSTTQVTSLLKLLPSHQLLACYLESSPLRQAPTSGITVMTRWNGLANIKSAEIGNLCRMLMSIKGTHQSLCRMCMQWVTFHTCLTEPLTARSSLPSRCFLRQEKFAVQLCIIDQALPEVHGSGHIRVRYRAMPVRAWVLFDPELEWCKASESLSLDTNARIAMQVGVQYH